jgi:hypothetical protein
MAVRKKGLRQVKVRGRQFYWKVREMEATVPEQGFVEQPEKRRVVDIIAANKRFIVHYGIPQAGEPYAELLVEGPEFPREPGAKRVEIPRWRHDSKRYPTADFVRRLIDFCMTDDS